MLTHAITRVVLTAGLVAAALSVPVYAQDKHPFEITSEGVKSRFVQQLFLDVDDATGHQVRVFENESLYPPENQPVIDGERIVETHNRGFSDYTAGVGPAWGYSTWTTDKGNKIFLEQSGSSETRTSETGSRRGVYHGTAKFVGGTGRFAGIRGVLVDVSEFDTDLKVGYSRSHRRGEYWFEQ